MPPTGQIFMKFDIWVFVEKLSRKFNFHQNLTRIMSTLLQDQYTFLIISCSVLLRMRNVSEKFVEKIKTLILYPISFFFENRAVYGVIWKNIVERGRPKMTI
jgi:hypothetical protein